MSWSNDAARIVWRLFRFRPTLLGAYLATDVFVSYAMFLVPGLLLRSVLDALSGQGHAALDPWLPLVLLALAQVLGFLLGGLGGWYSHQHAEQTYSTLLRANLFGRLVRRPAAEALPVPPADALTRFDRDVSQIGSRVVVWETAAEAVVILVAVALLAVLAGWVAALVIAPLAVVAIAASWVNWRVSAARQALQESNARITGLLAGVFGALPVVRAAGAEGAVGARFRDLADQRRVATLHDTLLTQLLRGVAAQSYGVAIGLVLVVLGTQLPGGGVSVGDIALVVTYAGTVGTLGSWLGGDLAVWSQTGVSLRRLQQLTPGTPAIALADPRPVLRGPLPPSRPRPAVDPLRSLRVRGLTCLLGGDPVLSDVDLDVEAGELVVVTGRLGAGKSTLLRALLGMRTSTGEVLWNDRPVRQPSTFLIPPRCAYLAQSPLLLSGTLRENLELGVPATDADVAAAIRAASLDADLQRFPQGLETRVGRHGLRLSGGQLQRVALARLLLARPSLAVLDDLSSALDTSTEHAILQQLRRLGMSCLAVAHRRSVLAAADRVVVLRSGRVEAAGSVRDLLARSAEFRAIWQSDPASASPGGRD